jgi:hypothetical protein
MENKKIAAIALIIAITLSASGLIYAHWTDTATINGNIQMGSLTLAYSAIEGPSAVPYYYDEASGMWKTGQAGGKNVASCSADFEVPITDSHTGKPGYKLMNITIDNAYPQFGVFTTFKVHNIGTVPLCLYGVSFTGEKKTSGGTHVYNLVMDYWYNTSLGNFEGKIYEDVDNSGNVTAGDKLIMYFLISDTSFPLQIDPCHYEKLEIDIEFKEDAEQCHAYTLLFQLWAVQWNKVNEVWPSVPQKS